jgi:hypothetical protein
VWHLCRMAAGGSREFPIALQLCRLAPNQWRRWINVALGYSREPPVLFVFRHIKPWSKCSEVVRYAPKAAPLHTQSEAGDDPCWKPVLEPTTLVPKRGRELLPRNDPIAEEPV